MRANIAVSQRDAMEVELKKKDEAQGKKAQLTPHDTDLAELPNSAPDTQFQEVREDVQPAHEDAKFAQTQPPNPGQNAKPASLTQTLDSLVQPTIPRGINPSVMKPKAYAIYASTLVALLLLSQSQHTCR